jgi:hypothetical protein
VVEPRRHRHVLVAPRRLYDRVGDVQPALADVERGARAASVLAIDDQRQPVDRLLVLIDAWEIGEQDVAFAHQEIGGFVEEIATGISPASEIHHGQPVKDVIILGGIDGGSQSLDQRRLVRSGSHLRTRGKLNCKPAIEIDVFFPGRCGGADTDEPRQGDEGDRAHGILRRVETCV